MLMERSDADGEVGCLEKETSQIKFLGRTWSTTTTSASQSLGFPRPRGLWDAQSVAPPCPARRMDVGAKGGDHQPLSLLCRRCPRRRRWLGDETRVADEAFVHGRGDDGAVWRTGLRRAEFDRPFGNMQPRRIES